jgi:hypothetical protein
VDDRGLQLAERAVHGHVRATGDIDLASAIDPYTKLRALGEALAAEGLVVELRTPDDEDPLGGVLAVREDEDSSPVEVVNFLNPHRTGRNPGREAIENAEPMAELDLRCVRLPELIALKLYAGTKRDELDVLALLEANPDADREAIRALCESYGLAERFDALSV